MPQRRRAGGSVVTSSPPITMRPVSGASKPAMRRKIVVFPLPDGPSSDRISPRAISHPIGPTTTAADHCLRTPASVTNPVTTPTPPHASPANALVPVAHPARAALGERVPVHVGDAHHAP